MYDIVKQKLLGYDLKESENLGVMVIEECRRLASSDIVRRNIAGLHSSITEYKLTIPIAEDFLTGILDMLLINESGIREVWDWKTNRIDSKEDMLVLSETYKIQMKIYAYFIKLLYPGEKEYSTRLLFTRRINSSANDEDCTVVVKWDEVELEQFGEELILLIKEIKSGD